jgi:hypothetical protein
MKTEYIINSSSNSKDNIIVSFGGLALKFHGIPPFEFLNHLSTNLDCEMAFYIDPKKCWYHQGIEGISSNIETTANYLLNIIKNFKNIIFIGVSAGGYAAILFGSLLKVNNVVAFIPQTHLETPIDVKYKDLSPFINNFTRYTLYGDSTENSLHDIEHCYRITEYNNVSITDEKNMNMKKMRDDGRLLKNFKSLMI